MKKLLATILAAALLLSMFSVTAFAAEDEKPALTTGPWDGYWWMTGGAVIVFYERGSDDDSYILRQLEGKLVVNNEAVAGATYDLNSNTLTIKDLKLPDSDLVLHYMGDDFKLNVEGDCELRCISVMNYIGYHSTSLNITGTGTLTVNAKKSASDAMFFYSDGKSMMHLDIADSVTVHLYAADNASEQYPQHVMRIWSTYCDPADGAITVGGKSIPEAKYEQNKDTIIEYVNGVLVDNTDKVYEHGKLVKSKADPDGVYAVKEIKYSEGNGFETRYGVTKYNYYSKFNMYLPDPDFSDSFYEDYIMYTKEDFEAQYTYVLEPQPKTVRYTTEWNEANRGYRGIKLNKVDDPDGIYIATDGWYTSYSRDMDEDIDTYYIYRLRWDEGEQIYVEEDSSYIDKVAAEDLEAKGYTIATEVVERQASLRCWVKSAPYDDDNYQGSFWLVNRKDDPDGLYAYVGTYTDRPWRDESGVVINPVVYDEENDEYYLRGYYGGTVGSDVFHVKDEDWNSDDPSFSYKTETVEQRVELQYVYEDYDFEYYSTEAVLLTKDGEPDNLYCDLEVDYDGEVHYIIPVEWREARGHYYATGYSEDEFDSVEAMEAAGYHQVIEPQPVEYTTTGAIKLFENRPLNKDSSGNSYFKDYNNTVYSISEGDKFTYGDTEYYVGTVAEGVSADDLNTVSHEELRDDYMYWIEGTEYHHEGTGVQPQPQILYGDANGDGDVTIDDVTYIQLYLVGREDLSGQTYINSDVNHDGAVTIDDATKIQRYLSGAAVDLSTEG